MDRQYPVYTADTECQDCYKCVRHCPVKAIQIQHARATIMPELCVACGSCVKTCPAGAKRVRGDVGAVQELLKSGRTVYLSLAPSYIGEFTTEERAVLATALKALGFAGVSETALGADAVSVRYRRLLLDCKHKLAISTACPVAVEFLQKYMPDYAEYLLPLPSPLMMHAQLLRSWYGEDIAVVFAGPCIAKKREADSFPGVVDAALTFRELRTLLTVGGIVLDDMRQDDKEPFVPHLAGRGAVYPVNGGMIDAVGDIADVDMVTISGLRQIRNAVQDLQATTLERPVFLELLACEGGCISGPGMTAEGGGLMREVAVRKRAREAVETPLEDDPVRDEPCCVLSEAPVRRASCREADIQGALLRVGKIKPEDELNCGGCGYETCRAFAEAMLDGRAEPAMCLSYLRRQAQKKANALLRSIPSGVVIVDADMRIVESNEQFAKIFGDDTLLAFQARPGLEGARLDKILPFAEAFRRVLQSNHTFRSDLMRVGERLLNVTVFSIEPFQTVGGIVQDVTETEQRRESIAVRASKVIDKNLATVQDIACRLGEHMADTELLLRSIAEDYSRPADDVEHDREGRL